MAWVRAGLMFHPYVPLALCIWHRFFEHTTFYYLLLVVKEPLINAARASSAAHGSHLRHLGQEYVPLRARLLACKVQRRKAQRTIHRRTSESIAVPPSD